MDVLEVCEQLILKTGLNFNADFYYQRIYLRNTGIYIQRFSGDEYEIRIDDINICLSSDLNELPIWIAAAIEALVSFKDSELSRLIYMKEKLTERLDD